MKNELGYDLINCWCLNPCFDRIYFQFRYCGKEADIYTSLNPCFDRIYFQSRYRTRNNRKMDRVSILVLIEFIFNLCIRFLLCRFLVVSILVLIEFIFNSTYFLSIGSMFMFICFIFYSFCGRVETI